MKSRLIGVISDTHGLMRPEALHALRGTDLMLHAGVIGNESVLEALRRIAPVVTVRGNNDAAAWAADIPETADVDVLGERIHLLHDIAQLGAAGRSARVVVYGHSHRPHNAERDGVLFFNPGSAGPRRFKLPICVGMLEVARGAVSGRTVELDVAPK